MDESSRSQDQYTTPENMLAWLWYIKTKGQNNLGLEVKPYLPLLQQDQSLLAPVGSGLDALKRHALFEFISELKGANAALALASMLNGLVTSEESQYFAEQFIQSIDQWLDQLIAVVEKNPEKTADLLQDSTVTHFLATVILFSYGRIKKWLIAIIEPCVTVYQYEVKEDFAALIAKIIKTKTHYPRCFDVLSFIVLLSLCGSKLHVDVMLQSLNQEVRQQWPQPNRSYLDLSPIKLLLLYQQSAQTIAVTLNSDQMREAYRQYSQGSQPSNTDGLKNWCVVSQLGQNDVEQFLDQFKSYPRKTITITPLALKPPVVPASALLDGKAMADDAEVDALLMQLLGGKIYTLPIAFTAPQLFLQDPHETVCRFRDQLFGYTGVNNDNKKTVAGLIKAGKIDKPVIIVLGTLSLFKGSVGHYVMFYYDPKKNKGYLIDSKDGNHLPTKKVDEFFTLLRQWPELGNMQVEKKYTGLQRGGSHCGRLLALLAYLQYHNIPCSALFEKEPLKITLANGKEIMVSTHDEHGNAKIPDDIAVDLSRQILALSMSRSNVSSSQSKEENSHHFWFSSNSRPTSEKNPFPSPGKK